MAQLIISDKPSCGGWQYAEEQGIATLHYNPKNTTGLSGSEVVDQLQAAGIEYVALAGYLKVSFVMQSMPDDWQYHMQPCAISEHAWPCPAWVLA